MADWRDELMGSIRPTGGLGHVALPLVGPMFALGGGAPKVPGEGGDRDGGAPKVAAGVDAAAEARLQFNMLMNRVGLPPLSGGQQPPPAQFLQDLLLSNLSASSFSLPPTPTSGPGRDVADLDWGVLDSGISRFMLEIWTNSSEPPFDFQRVLETAQAQAPTLLSNLTSGEGIAVRLIRGFNEFPMKGHVVDDFFVLSFDSRPLIVFDIGVTERRKLALWLLFLDLLFEILAALLAVLGITAPLAKFKALLKSLRAPSRRVLRRGIIKVKKLQKSDIDAWGELRKLFKDPNTRKAAAGLVKAFLEAFKAGAATGMDEAMAAKLVAAAALFLMAGGVSEFLKKQAEEEAIAAIGGLIRALAGLFILGGVLGTAAKAGAEAKRAAQLIMNAFNIWLAMDNAPAKIEELKKAAGAGEFPAGLDLEKLLDELFGDPPNPPPVGPAAGKGGAMEPGAEPGGAGAAEPGEMGGTYEGDDGTIIKEDVM